MVRDRGYEDEESNWKKRVRQWKLDRTDGDRAAAQDVDPGAALLVSAAREQAVTKALRESGALEQWLKSLRIVSYATGVIIAQYAPEAQIKISIPEISKHPIDAPNALHEISNIRISSKARQPSKILNPDKLIALMERLGLPLSGELAERREEIMVAAQGRGGHAGP